VAEAPASGTPAADQPAASSPATPAPAQPEPAAPTAEATTPPAAETPASPPAVAEAPAAAKPAAPAASASDAPAAVEPALPEAGEAEKNVAAAPAPESELPAPPPAGVDEVLAPKLQSVDSAVIIRRGDTLWRISRRVYGRGIRYSTIYLANEKQIEDPDRIWPGQVFTVPEKSNDGKADADYTTLGDRLTTVPKEGDPDAAPPEAQQ
jgi:nucleoid-associated protein YgaU